MSWAGTSWAAHHRRWKYLTGSTSSNNNNLFSFVIGRSFMLSRVKDLSLKFFLSWKLLASRAGGTRHTYHTRNIGHLESDTLSASGKNEVFYNEHTLSLITALDSNFPMLRAGILDCLRYSWGSPYIKFKSIRIALKPVRKLGKIWDPKNCDIALFPTFRDGVCFGQVDGNLWYTLF